LIATDDTYCDESPGEQYHDEPIVKASQRRIARLLYCVTTFMSIFTAGFFIWLDASHSHADTAYTLSMLWLSGGVSYWLLTEFTYVEGENL
jgi:hypothetical protein